MREAVIGFFGALGNMQGSGYSRQLRLDNRFPGELSKLLMVAEHILRTTETESGISAGTNSCGFACGANAETANI